MQQLLRWPVPPLACECCVLQEGSCQACWQLGRHADLGECPSPNQHPPSGSISGKRHPAAARAVLNQQALFCRAALPFGIPVQPRVCLLDPALEQLPPLPPPPHVVVANNCALTCGVGCGISGRMRFWVYWWRLKEM